MRVKTRSLRCERMSRREKYPFDIRAIASLETVDIASWVCLFVGENGAGKSLRREAIAAHYGCELAGGNRNFSPHTTGSVSAIEPLTKGLRFSFTKKTGGGFYLRAESSFNMASPVDAVVRQTAKVARTFRTLFPAAASFHAVRLLSYS